MITDKEFQKLKERIEKLEKEIFAKKSIKNIQGKTGGLLELFQTLKEEDFFSNERTPKEILNRLAEKGRIYKRVQSLTEPLLRATKNNILNRKKTDKGWVYFS
jgi:hypothetical protein